MIKESHTGYSNTGSYSGQDMTRHTNITQSSSTTGWSKNKHSQINRTQTKPGNIQRATTRGAGRRRRAEEEGRRRGVQGEWGSSCRCSGDGKSTCWRFSNRYRHTDSTDTAEHRYWPVHCHSNCPSAAVGSTLSSGNVKAEFTGGRGYG